MGTHVRDSDVNLGIFWIAPNTGPRECRHSTRLCPHVVAGFQYLAPGDDGYSHILRVLDECDWCRKYRHGLVTPLDKKARQRAQQKTSV